MTEESDFDHPCALEPEANFFNHGDGAAAQSVVKI